MKITPNNTAQTSSRLTYENALIHIHDVFGYVEHDLDEYCIYSISINYNRDVVLAIIVKYDRIKVKLDTKDLFWPIQPFEKAIDIEEGLQLIKRKLNAA